MNSPEQLRSGRTSDGCAQINPYSREWCEMEVLKAVLLMVILTTTAQAQSLSQFVMNDAEMQKYNRAHDNLQRVAREHPKLAQLIKMRAHQMDRVAPNLNSNPLLRQAVQDAGLTTEKYALRSSIVLVVGFALLMETDAEALALLREAKVHPANLKFFKKYLGSSN